MFNRVKTLAIILVLLTASVTPALAWDEVGHKITAYIAWQQMRPEVRARVIKTLMAAPEDAQLSTFYSAFGGGRTEEARQREFFMLAATWPDIIRDRNFPVRFKGYAHSDWHYADTFWQITDGQVVAVPDAEASGKAMDKIADFDKLIRSNGTDAEKAVAVAWLEHLIGDIHQPLHAESLVTPDNPKGDQGGNLFLLTPKGTPRDKQENLHWFWDSIAIRYQPNTKDLCDADYIDPPTGILDDGGAGLDNEAWSGVIAAAVGLSSTTSDFRANCGGTFVVDHLGSSDDVLFWDKFDFGYQ